MTGRAKRHHSYEDPEGKPLSRGGIRLQLPRPGCGSGRRKLPCLLAKLSLNESLAGTRSLVRTYQIRTGVDFWCLRLILSRGSGDGARGHAFPGNWHSNLRTYTAMNRLLGWRHARRCSSIRRAGKSSTASEPRQYSGVGGLDVRQTSVCRCARQAKACRTLVASIVGHSSPLIGTSGRKC